MNDGDKLQRAAQAIAESDALLITAGAGMGVDSGLPDFRGPEGFWRAYPAYARLGLRFEQMANPSHFATDPALGWGFYGHRTNLYRQTTPHEGFSILKRWSEGMPRGSFVYTSNVDDHFRRSGFEASRILECHGSIEWWQCLDLCGVGIFPAHEAEIAVDPETFRAIPPLPSCPNCGGLARPNILMFGDRGWEPRRTAEQRERGLSKWLEGLTSSRLAIVEFGAGKAVPTVRLFSEEVASVLGATLIRVNLREADVPRGQIGLAMGALDAIRAIDALLTGSSGQPLDPG